MSWADLIYLAIVCAGALLGFVVAAIYGLWALQELVGFGLRGYRWLRVQLVPTPAPRLIDAEAEGWLPDPWEFPRRWREEGHVEIGGVS